MTFAAMKAHNLLAPAFGTRARSVNRLDPVAAGLIDHVGDGPFDLKIGHAGVAAVRWHLANPVDRVAGETRQSLRRPLFPGLPVADLRRTVGARTVTSDAGCVDHGLAAARLVRGACRTG